MGVRSEVWGDAAARRTKGVIARNVDSTLSFSIFVWISAAVSGRHAASTAFVAFLTKSFTHQLVHRRLREGRAADPDARAE